MFEMFAGGDAIEHLGRYAALEQVVEHDQSLGVAKFHSAGEALSAVVTDWAWGCPAHDWDRGLAAHTPVYAYEFADETAPWFSTLANPTGAFGAELQQGSEREPAAI